MYYNLHYKIKYKVKTSAVIFVFSIQCLIYHLPEIISLKKMDDLPKYEYI